jgi:hypothetical protein
LLLKVTPKLVCTNRAKEAASVPEINVNGLLGRRCPTGPAGDCIRICSIEETLVVGRAAQPFLGAALCRPRRQLHLKACLLKIKGTK